MLSRTCLSLYVGAPWREQGGWAFLQLKQSLSQEGQLKLSKGTDKTSHHGKH